MTHESLMSGVVILLSKKTWALLGGFPDGFLGVDNAIHQAARDQDCRVYLMEGVYVYHWYRADTHRSAHSVNGGYAAVSNGRDRRRTVMATLTATTWGRLSVAGHRILLIGHDVAAAGEYVRNRNPASLTIVEMDQSVVEQARERLGDVYVADDEGNGIDVCRRVV